MNVCNSYPYAHDSQIGAVLSECHANVDKHEEVGHTHSHHIRLTLPVKLILYRSLSLVLEGYVLTLVILQVVQKPLRRTLVLLPL